MMRTLLLLLALLLMAVPVSAETVVFGNIYPGNYSSLSGLPGVEQPMIGQFGVRYGTNGRIVRVISDVETMVIKEEVKTARYNSIGSVFYRVTLAFSVTPKITLSLAHGSWHGVDRVGPRRTDNHIGMEFRIK